MTKLAIFLFGFNAAQTIQNRSYDGDHWYMASNICGLLDIAGYSQAVHIGSHCCGELIFLFCRAGVVMRCELCSKIIQQYETAHGLRYGSVDIAQDIFLPARDSAIIVICSSCGELLCKLIYSKLKNNAGNDPSLSNTFHRSR